MRRIRVLDPTHEQDAGDGRPAARPASLDGAEIGIITNGKEGTSGLFAHISQQLRARLGVSNVHVRQKASYSAPAETKILDEAKQWAAVITGVGD